MTHLPPAGSRYVVRDPQVLRALAHPLRGQLLGLLRVEGAATASQLGNRLGVSSGVTSYHLRELERYGFVGEVQGRGTRRERWWQALHQFTSWSRDTVAGADEAAEALQEQFLAQRVRCYQAWWHQRSERAPRWREAGTFNDLAIRLTPEQTEAMSQELGEVILRWGARSAAPGSPGTGEVVVFADVLPLTERPL